MTATISETAKDVVRRNTEEVQGRGNWALFNELFANDFFDHTPQPGGTRDKAGVLALYNAWAKPSRISRRRFIGSASTATWSPPSRLITARIEGIFSASLAQATKSDSRPSMQCASSTVRSPSTGEWQTSTRSCSSWARSLHCRRLEKVDAHEVAHRIDRRRSPFKRALLQARTNRSKSHRKRDTRPGCHVTSTGVARGGGAGERSEPRSSTTMAKFQQVTPLRPWPPGRKRADPLTVGQLQAHRRHSAPHGRTSPKLGLQFVGSRVEDFQ
jgi:hypothetical protein